MMMCICLELILRFHVYLQHSSKHLFFQALFFLLKGAAEKPVYEPEQERFATSAWRNCSGKSKKHNFSQRNDDL